MAGALFHLSSRHRQRLVTSRPMPTSSFTLGTALSILASPIISSPLPGPFLLRVAASRRKRAPICNQPHLALAVAWGSGRSAVPSQRSLLVVSRCSRAPSRPSAESLTFSMARLYLLEEGVMLCCIPACSLRWNVPGSHCQEEHGYLQTLETHTKDPFSVKPNEQSRLQISLEKRDHSIAEDDSRPLLPLSDVPAELPTNSSTAEDSRAAWSNTLLDKLLSSPDQSLKRLEQVEGDRLCCSHLGLPAWGYFHGIHLYLSNRNTASLPERL